MSAVTTIPLEKRMYYTRTGSVRIDDQPRAGAAKKRTEKNSASNTRQDFLFGVDMTPRVNRASLSQWFTPEGIALGMARWALELAPKRHCRILEPSAGSGALTRALFDVFGQAGQDAYVDAHEIDPRWAEQLPAGVRTDARRFFEMHVHEGDFRVAKRPDFIYSVSCMNPPYEGGMDGLFLEACMTCSDGIVILIRSAALHGAGRCKAIWRRCQPGGEWVIPRLAKCEDRPDFEGSGAVKATEGAKSEFSVVQMRRRRPSDPVHVPTLLEWW